MKAVVINSYGGPTCVQVKELDTPTLAANDVLVRVRAAGVNAGDLFTVTGSPWMIRFTVGFPKPTDHVLGWDVAGHVEAVGASVTRFEPGDEVFGSVERAFAEYVSADADKLAIKPANLDFEQAAALPTAACTALEALRTRGAVRAGHKVLIHGASGGVGTFAVQIAKALGAHVTAVCSTAKVAAVASLGADIVVDYTKQDVTETAARYDLILDNSASRAYSDLKKVLAPNGRILPNSGHGGMRYVFKAYVMSSLSRRYGRPFMVVPNHEMLTVIKDYCEAGTLRPLVDRVYPMADAASALAHLEQRRTVGKVVLTM